MSTQSEVQARTAAGDTGSMIAVENPATAEVIGHVPDMGEEVEPRRDVNVKADRAAIRARRVARAMVEEELSRATSAFA